MNVTGGATDVTTYFVMRLAADGTEATGLTITNFDLQYVRTGDTPVAATNSAHGDNQAIEIDATDQPGLYRVDWPDAAFAAGVKQVILSVKCATCFTEHLAVNIDAPVTATGMAAGVITAAAIATGAIDADAIADNAIDAGAIAADAITAAKIANGAIDAATFAADVDAEILSYLVDDATRIDASALNTASGTTIPAIVADTNELQTDWANGGRLDLILDARSSQTSVDDLPTNAELATALGTADDAVLAQVALVKAKTDSLTFTVAGQVDANIQYVNDVTVNGTGAGGDEWGP
jgi:hypothetical protein